MFDILLDVMPEPSFMERNGTAIWITVAVLALAGLVGLFVWNKRRKQGATGKPDAPSPSGKTGAPPPPVKTHDPA